MILRMGLSAETFMKYDQDIHVYQDIWSVNTRLSGYMMRIYTFIRIYDQDIHVYQDI